MSTERRAHKDSCSCQACVYQRAKLRLPVAQVRRVEPSYRPGLYLAMDEIAETVATYAPDDWSGSCEDARRALVRAMAEGCEHWHAREVCVCPDCGETWDFGE